MLHNSTRYKISEASAARSAVAPPSSPLFWRGNLLMLGCSLLLADSKSVSKAGLEGCLNLCEYMRDSAHHILVRQVLKSVWIYANQSGLPQQYRVLKVLRQGRLILCDKEWIVWW